MRGWLAGLLGAMRGHWAVAGDLAGAMGHFLKVTRSDRPGLFACRDAADRPLTNNALEQAFGSHGWHERRASPVRVLRGIGPAGRRLATRQREVTAADLARADRAAWRKLRAGLEEERLRRPAPPPTAGSAARTPAWPRYAGLPPAGCRPPWPLRPASAGIPRSANTTSTVPLTAGVSPAVRAATGPRSWSLAAVPRTASTRPRVSTATGTFDPFRRLCPSYPACHPLSGVDWMAQPSNTTADG